MWTDYVIKILKTNAVGIWACYISSSNTPVSQKLQYMTLLHIHFNIVVVYLQYVLQTSWSVHLVYTATVLLYTVSLLRFGVGFADLR